MKTIYTAIFGNYDDLKEPRVVTPGWRYICFTDQPLKSKVWEIAHRPMLAPGNHRTARYYKIMFHRHIETEFSIWLDASFVINCNLDEWWQRYKQPITCVRHPHRDCVYEEANACIRQVKDAHLVSKQILNYRNIGMPAGNGVISSGIIMRSMDQEVINLCDLWWQEVERFSVRDQISFAYATWKLPIHNLTEYDYSTGLDFLYLYHLHSPKRKAKTHYYKSLNLLQ